MMSVQLLVMEDHVEFNRPSDYKMLAEELIVDLEDFKANEEFESCLYLYPDSTEYLLDLLKSEVKRNDV
jgi:hypothetical protein